MRYWLMKTEPEVFSFDDLRKAKDRTSSWEGVRNYQARNLMRDEFKKGDKVLIYHSNADVTGVAGVAQVVREGYPDHLSLDSKSDYFDEKLKGKKETPWVMVDVQATHSLKNIVTRDMMRAEPRLKNIMVLRKGARLSVQPLTEAEFETLLELGKPTKL